MKASALPVIRDDDDFPGLRAAVTAHFESTSGPYFTTAADGDALFGLFLSHLREDLQQVYRCHACRTFFRRYGNLVTIDEGGVASPAVWPATVPEPFGDAVASVREAVRRAKVTGVFLSGEEVWGTPQTGYWSHLSLRPKTVYRDKLKTAEQAMAEKREEHRMLVTVLAEFPPSVVEQAVKLLESDSLYRSEKVLRVAKWLLALQGRVSHRANRLWRAVATAPTGWCHVRSTMVGTLLEDIAAGMAFDVFARRFREKMHPLLYQRPQAPPKAGTIDRAEEIVAKLGVAASLKRRFATLDDIEKLWVPKPIEVPRDGVFGHLREKAAGQLVDAPEQRITWTRFVREVLPKADAIEYLVPYSGPFITFVTAEDATAPLLFQWGNPVSWYVDHKGSAATQFGLRAGEWARVTAVCLFPPQWGGVTFAQHKPGAALILDGAVDSKGDTLGLFPECLRSEYHEIRSVIEAHSRAGKLSGAERASACGVDLRGWDQSCRVTTGGLRLSYLIDRWE